VEALAAAFYITGFDSYASKLLSGFGWGGAFWKVNRYVLALLASSYRLFSHTPENISRTIQGMQNGRGGHRHARTYYRRSREELGRISEAERYFLVYRCTDTGMLKNIVEDDTNGEDLLVSNPNHLPPFSDEDDTETDSEHEKFEKHDVK
jgi:pre-rRNA-processing protein TSR3